MGKPGPKPKPWIERFNSKIEMPDGIFGCWLWKGRLHSGYGQIYLNGKMKRAHRVSYELYHGQIPKGLVIDHECHVRNCVNPFHLRACTIGENVMADNSQALAKLKSIQTHCKRGHLFDESSTYIRKDGRRECQICQSARHQSPKYKENQKEYYQARKQLNIQE